MTDSWAVVQARAARYGEVAMVTPGEKAFWHLAGLIEGALENLTKNYPQDAFTRAVKNEMGLLVLKSFDYYDEAQEAQAIEILDIEDKYFPEDAEPPF